LLSPPFRRFDVQTGDPRKGSSRLSRCIITIVTVSLSIVLTWSGVALAGMGASAAPTFPTAVVAGATGVPASITLKNDNTDPQVSSTICNYGDLSPCPAPTAPDPPGITLIPSCGQLSGFTDCDPVGADPGVFQLSPTAIGQVGTACADMGFNVQLIPGSIFGMYRFTPESSQHVVLPTPGSVCVIDFTFDVLQVATVDQNPGVPGQQTVQVVANTQRESAPGSLLTASGRGTSTGTTVARATPTLATSAAPNLVLGAGTMADNVTVSGRVNPQPGATVDFRLYGPNDATCSGTPVFESLNLPYPVTGGPVVSAPFTPSSVGAHRWIASYSGDANNSPVSGVCNDSNEITVVTPAAPTIATVASVNINLGTGLLTDRAMVTGRINPQPGATVDFRLYGPNDAVCSGVPVFESLGVPYPVEEGPVTSASFVPTVAGDYRWVASYSGDANNAAVTGACNNANEMTTVSPPRPITVVSAGPLPATGSTTSTLLYIALGLTLTGGLMVGSTSRRRRVLQTVAASSPANDR
jgi:LPXTG-motif cell wall-anchored protein